MPLLLSPTLVSVLTHGEVHKQLVSSGYPRLAMHHKEHRKKEEVQPQIMLLSISFVHVIALQ
eukprot:6635135-Ditylum_brightwellii.AAC.1